MSGIYGYVLASGGDNCNQEILGGLEYWNRIYGSEAHDQQQVCGAGLGCHVEHFSDRYPHGTPILQMQDRYAVVDALLYNRDELLPILGEDAGCDVSDEELLLRWIDAKGWDALAQVNGDFSGAVYDPANQEWTLFRDHLGMRPLYLYMDDALVAFSTDIRGLLALPQVDAGPNEMRLFKKFINQNYLSLLETEYAHIHFVRPAAVTRIRPDASGFRLRERPYWKLHSKKVRLGSDEEYQQELRRLITDSVRRRLDAFPGLIGAELSGGLDSGVIDILINRLGREACYVSWSPAPDVLPLRDGEDERHVINDICRQEGIECSYLHSRDKIDFSGMTARAVPQNFDTPNLGFGAALLRSKGARVVFTGHGGDEGVSHRCNRLEPLVYGEYLSFYKLYRDDLQGIRLRSLKAFKSIAQDLRRLTKKVSNPATEEDLNDPFFTRAFCSRMRADYRDELFTFAFDPVKYIMTGATQHRVDNAAYQGAYNGVRYVYPYLDHRVLDYAVSIPRVQYLGKQNRRVFREAFRDILPDSLYDLRYKDFASKRDIPRSENYHEAFRTQLQLIVAQLDPDVWGGIFDLDYIAQLQPTGDHGSAEEFNVLRKVNSLKQLILMQNAREKALKWREFDEQGLLL